MLVWAQNSFVIHAFVLIIHITMNSVKYHHTITKIKISKFRTHNRMGKEKERNNELKDRKQKLFL